MSAPAPHGSPAGYEAGCHSAGGCTNHGSAELLTCLEAATARRSDWTLSRLPADQAITRAALIIPKTPKRADPNPASAPAKTQRRTSTRIPGSPPKASPANSALCPSIPTRNEAAQDEPWIRNAPGHRHGTITGYWIDDCTEESGCPATPSCAAVAAGAPSSTRPAALTEKIPQLTQAKNRPRKAKQPRKQAHGSVFGYRRGCRSETECPNLTTGGQSCYQAHHAYYDDYRAKVKSGNGPEVKLHGRVSGYQMGCKSREKCPEHLAGRTSCRDAAAAAELRRRRTAGIPERPPMVDSGPVMKHIAHLRSKGMSIVAIGTAAEVSKTGIRTLVYGREDRKSDGSKGPRHGEMPKHTDAEKARKILAVQFVERTRTSTAEHGTRNGYRRLGCRSQTDCPNVTDGGTSCYQANVDYQAAHRTPPPSRPQEQRAN